MSKKSVDDAYKAIQDTVGSVQSAALSAVEQVDVSLTTASQGALSGTAYVVKQTGSLWAQAVVRILIARVSLSKHETHSQKISRYSHNSLHTLYLQVQFILLAAIVVQYRIEK